MDVKPKQNRDYFDNGISTVSTSILGTQINWSLQNVTYAKLKKVRLRNPYRITAYYSKSNTNFLKTKFEMFVEVINISI